LVAPEPKKRPKSSYRRFEADQPNECWQSDFTHWQLADGTGVEIINSLDDHSRYLLSATARPRISGEDVVTTFLAAAGPRAPTIDPHLQRVGLHLSFHRWLQRLRIPTREPRHRPEERPPQRPANPRQDRTLPPNPETRLPRSRARHCGRPLSSRTAGPEAPRGEE
jgi:hypothetical protein